MARLLALWNQFSLTQKSTLVGVMLMTFFAFAWLATASSRIPMALLYGGLDDATAGDVLASLEAMDIDTEVRDRAIYVPRNKRDSARLALARQGLPQQGQPGFELLEKVNGYSTTSDMFNAAYWRAKEGELARTILATPGIKSVRVHLSVPKSSAFSRTRKSAKASATITMARGVLSQQQALAVRYLISLAVPDLQADQVAIIDSVRGVILKPGHENGGEPYPHDNDRSKAIEDKLLQLLEARVGRGNARVTVSLEFDREGEFVTERIMDPESRILTNRDVTELSEIGTESRRAVTVASNLPEGDVGGTNPSSSERSETRENSEYGYSEVNRQRKKEPGAVTRTHVAVLLNNQITESADGKIESLPRDQEELDAIQELVAAAVGFDASRGDVITIKSLGFHVVNPLDGALAERRPLDFVKDNFIGLMQIIIPAIVCVVLGLFVLKPVLSKVPDQNLDRLLAVKSDPEKPETTSEVARSPVETMRTIAAENSQTSALILKSWLGETDHAG